MFSLLFFELKSCEFDDKLLIVIVGMLSFLESLSEREALWEFELSSGVLT